MFNLDETLSGLHKKMDRHELLLVSGVGSGLTGAAAVKGGADILAVYHTAAYRIQGIPSILSNLPYDDCNDVTLRLLPQILVTSGDTPVIAGLGAHDVRKPHQCLLDRVVSLGGCGVVNEPFIGAYKGLLRERLEAAGLGFQCEVDLIKKAADRKLLTLAWCFGPEDAVKMVQAGANIIGALILPNPGKEPSMEDMVRYVSSIIDVVEKEGVKVPVIIHGAPVNNMEAAKEVIRRTGAAGYAAGSSGERMPVLDGISETIAEFRSI